jgi:hypothetical protein
VRARQRTGWQARQRDVLGARQRRDQAQEAGQLMAFGQRLQPLGATREDGREIGQTDKLALGDLAESRFAETAR